MCNLFEETIADLLDDKFLECKLKLYNDRPM